jgi:tRNA-(ms[2]io[6]A)-hydroxylase
MTNDREPVTKIRYLQTPTSTAWIEQAIAHIDIVLLDHSHCERKAAGVALNLLCRYPSSVELVRQLTVIAK